MKLKSVCCLLLFFVAFAALPEQLDAWGRRIRIGVRVAVGADIRVGRSAGTDLSKGALLPHFSDSVDAEKLERLKRDLSDDDLETVARIDALITDLQAQGFNAEQIKQVLIDSIDVEEDKSETQERRADEKRSVNKEEIRKLQAEVDSLEK